MLRLARVPARTARGQRPAAELEEQRGLPHTHRSMQEDGEPLRELSLEGLEEGGSAEKLG